MADDRVVIEIVLDDGSVVKGFQKVQKSGKKAAKSIDRNFGKFVSTRFKQLAGDIVRLGSAFAGVAGIIKVTRDVIDFGKATAEIRTISQGLAIDQEKLNKQLIETSKQFGTSASEQAKSFYQIISAGITDAARANEALIAANKLAIGGLTTTTGAIDLLTSAVNAFGQENLSANRAADIIFGTVRLGKTRVEELQSSLGQILPTAAALGVSFEDVAAALAQLTTRGVSTSESVTQLNAVLTAVLKKQETARTLGPKVAKAFSLQALQAKGLSKFLNDLNKALGGSEEKLVKLLGRAEGARAIITLAADNFVGLSNKIDQLKNSSGAADEAFNIINKTLGQQLNRTVSIISGKILELTSRTEGGLVDAVTALNTALENLGRILRIIAITATTFVAVFKGGAIFGAIALGVSSVIGALSILQLQLRSTIVTFGALRAAGFTTFTSLTTVMQTTTFAVRALNVATKILLGTLTLGLIFGIDFLIQKFGELSDKLGGAANVFKTLGLIIKIDVLGAITEVVRILVTDFPKIASAMGITIGTFQKFASQVGVAKGELRKLNEEAAKAAQIKPPPVVPPPGADGEETETIADKIRRLREELIALQLKSPEAFATVGTAFEEFSNGFTLAALNLAKNSKAAFQQIGKSAFKFLGQGVGNAFASVGRAIAQGENALDAFLNSLLASFGAMAIQLGTQFILTGIAFSWNGLPNGPPLIAAGAALATFGGVLSAIGGGGAAGGGPSTSIGSAGAADDITDDQDVLTDDDDFQRQTAVTVNVEGTVLDPIGVGTQIAELLSEITDSNDIKVNV